MRAILTYHSIDPSGSVISLDERTFSRHADWLARANVQVTTVEELLRLPASADAVAITFDDAFVNFAQAAWPRLKEHDLPVTLFVPTDFVGRHNGWHQTTRVPSLPLLDWPALARLAEDGVALGSHSRTHRDLRRLAASELDDEIGGAAERIAAETGRSPAGFAYPSGYSDARVVDMVGARHRWACGTELGLLGNDSKHLLLPRLDAYYYSRPGRLEAWGTQGFLAYLWVRVRARRLRHGLAAVTGAA